MFVLPLCPESPKCLLMDKDDEARATESLVWLRAKLEVHQEMDEMKQEHLVILKANNWVYFPKKLIDFFKK